MIDYAKAGVDVHAGYKSVELMRRHVESTRRPEVLGGIGGFGGLFSLAKVKETSDPVLVSGTDGVGTKVKAAFLQNKHDTIGIDCVAMCVNDIICSGAEPLFFLDYIACGKNDPEKIAEIVSGVAEGCRQAGCALIGGETAEHPGLMPEDEYDLAGFAVGVVERGEIIDGRDVKPGDKVIGVKSSGTHSTGFSLIRKLFTEDELKDPAFLTPTRIYVETAKKLRPYSKAISHITGGGFYENLPRMLPEGLGLDIEVTWEIPEIFTEIQKRAGLDRDNMFGTFNMGIGLAVVVSEVPEGFDVIGTVTGSGRICIR